MGYSFDEARCTVGVARAYNLLLRRVGGFGDVHCGKNLPTSLGNPTMYQLVIRLTDNSLFYGELCSKDLHGERHCYLQNLVFMIPTEARFKHLVS